MRSTVYSEVAVVQYAFTTVQGMHLSHISNYIKKYIGLAIE